MEFPLKTSEVTQLAIFTDVLATIDSIDLLVLASYHHLRDLCHGSSSQLSGG